MIQMRWFKWYMIDDNNLSHERKKLQYRQKIDPTVRSGLWKEDATLWAEKMVWSEWMDVTTVWEDELKEEEHV